MKANGVILAGGGLAAVLLGGCASPRGANVSDFSAEQAQVERRLHEVFSAAEQKDFERLDSYHFYGGKFTKFAGSLPERLDSETARAGEHRGLGAITGLKIRADGLKIDVFGDVAVATFIMDYSYETGGKPMQSKERSTLVFVKVDGVWRIAHEHLSTVK